MKPTEKYHENTNNNDQPDVNDENDDDDDATAVDYNQYPSFVKETITIKNNDLPNDDDDDDDDIDCFSRQQ